MFDKMDGEMVDRQWLSSAKELALGINQFLSKAESTDKDNMEWAIKFTHYERDTLNRLLRNVILP